jgi:hypothetical protein
MGVPDMPPAASINGHLIAGENQVSRVVDWDTIIVVHGSVKLKIRLTGIDAPEVSHAKNEPGQPFRQQSTKHLAGLVLNKVIPTPSKVAASIPGLDSRIFLQITEEGRGLVGVDTLLVNGREGVAGGIQQLKKRRVLRFTDPNKTNRLTSVHLDLPKFCGE